MHCVFSIRRLSKLSMDSVLSTVRQLPFGWLRGTVVERRFLAGDLSLFCARPAADG